MRGRRRAKTDDSNVPLAPFVDVVLALAVLFFILAPYGAEKVIGVNVGLPSPHCEFVHYVELSENGVVSIYGWGPDRASSDPTVIQTHLERIHTEFSGCAVVVYASPKAKAGSLVQLQDLAYNAGHSDNFTFATKTSGPYLSLWSRHWVHDY
jgi:biopolymer transport protein ExbD